jgi:hypothetical protein
MTFPAEPRHSTTSPTSPGIPEARLATTVLQRLRLAELLCSSADGSMANQHVFQQPHSHRWIIRGMYMILYIYMIIQIYQISHCLTMILLRFGAFGHHFGGRLQLPEI